MSYSPLSCGELASKLTERMCTITHFIVKPPETFKVVQRVNEQQFVNHCAGGTGRNEVKFTNTLRITASCLTVVIEVQLYFILQSSTLI